MKKRLSGEGRLQVFFSECKDTGKPKQNVSIPSLFRLTRLCEKVPADFFYEKVIPEFHISLVFARHGDIVNYNLFCSQNGNYSSLLRS